MTEPDYKDFWVHANSTPLYDVSQSWVEVVHTLCGATIFGADVGEDDSTLAELLFIVQAHRCSE
jgi:hypothetical protein